MKESPEWDTLIQKHLDGQTTTEEATALSERIVADAEVRSRYLKAARVHAALADEVLALDLETEPDQSAVLKEQRGVIWHFAWPRQIAAALVAGLFVGLLVLGGFVWLSGKPSDPELGIARVIRVEGEVLVDGTRVLAGGDELFTAENVSITNGLIELAFRETGVHVLATAPLSIRLDSTERMFLRQGEMKLVVPPQGVGFVVATPERKITDLGTSFVVKAGPEGSKVLVLDGQIAVGEHAGEPEELMHEGEFARFDRNGKLEKRSPSRLSLALPELSLPVTKTGTGSLRGMIFGHDGPPVISKLERDDDVIGQDLLPLIRSGFQDRACLGALKPGEPISFRGIAGAYRQFPDRIGLAPYSSDFGWMAWYHGDVIPPRPGRYRFWGYADNHLLVAIDGKPVFEGSRNNSSLKKLGIPRADNPSLPCLIAKAGFARGEWIELSGDSVQLDILFGEVNGNITSGLLLVEREGDTYEETFWGQPKWPLFLTEAPGGNEIAEFKRLVHHLEEKTMGSFSIAEDAVWKVAQ